jgi:hypothetical protein
MFMFIFQYHYQQHAAQWFIMMQEWKKILIFFPKTGHFEHIIRHDIKIFGKKYIFSSQNLGFFKFNFFFKVDF